MGKSMIDTKLLRTQPDEVAKRLKPRGFNLDVSVYTNLEDERRSLQSELQDLQARRNQQSKLIAKAKAKGEPIDNLPEELRALGDKMRALSGRVSDVQDKLREFSLLIPNIPLEEVPVGSSESDNVEIRRWGTPKEFDFKPKDHMSLGQATNGIDLSCAAKLSGSRFVVLRGHYARLHRALAQFMLDLHVNEFGYEEVYVPFIVYDKVMEGTGQLPKLKDDQFQLEGQHNFSLIPTGEVPLTNLVREDILDQAALPLKFVAHTPCFRKEAGSYGKDTRGIIRLHQFEKVELVQIVQPEQSLDALHALTGHAEEVLKRLDLPYRVMSLCTADLGFSATKTYDLEVWLPSQDTYREISSCSVCGDFQARRMKARYRDASTGKNAYVHTLNGSGLAIGRTLVAVLENYQQADGRVCIPEVLRPYLGGLEWL